MNFSALTTIIIGLGLIWALFLLAGSLRQFGRASRAGERPDDDLPPEFGPRVTSRRLGYVRWCFVLALLVALGFHFYWAGFSVGPVRVDPAFAGLKDRRDQRNRREVESTLRGWIYDRHHDVRQSLAKYRYLNGHVQREYPLGQAASHLVGYGTFVRGDSALERAVNSTLREAGNGDNQENSGGIFAALTSNTELPPVGRDLVTTIDADLQREAFAQIRDRQAGVVVIDPRNGELLAMASSPGFDPEVAESRADWAKLRTDERRKPLVNRVLSEYYLPGSTLKTMTAAAAIESNLDGRTFYCQREGWTPPGSGRPIRDDQQEAHGTVDLAEAMTVSCNQYFAQLGVEVDRQRMGETATRFGLRLFANPKESIGSGRHFNLWNTGNRVLSSVLAPFNSTFVSGRGVSRYDLALESIGQGYVQVTPFQMALVAAGIANRNGSIMRPTIEQGRQPVQLSQAASPATAARLRQMMAEVVRRGTAKSLGAILAGTVTVGGKTGTAQRLVPVYDPATGRRITFRDAKGREQVRREFRIDSWFIGFAPVENPQIAFAIVVEGGGYGAATSAPIAGNLIRRAIQTGLIR